MHGALQHFRVEFLCRTGMKLVGRIRTEARAGVPCISNPKSYLNLYVVIKTEVKLCCRRCMLFLLVFITLTDKFKSEIQFFYFIANLLAVSDVIFTRVPTIRE